MAEAIANASSNFYLMQDIFTDRTVILLHTF